MWRTVSTVVLGIALLAGTAQASSAEPKNLQLFNAVSNAVNTYDRYTIFDNVNIGVMDGAVTLSGKVTLPIKRDELGKRIAKVAGVTQVNNEISVLPLSPTDDQLRSRIARAIYGNQNFWAYEQQSPGPIHIVVEDGRVTLTGVVANEVDRMMAGAAANQSLAFSVTNSLKTDAEVKAELEKL